MYTIYVAAVSTIKSVIVYLDDDIDNDAGIDIDNGKVVVMDS